jgi:subtilisin family serine protease
MRFKSLCVLVLLCGLWPAKASADNRLIVRTTLGLQMLQTVCSPPLLPPICTVVGGLGDPLGQLFVITSPLDLDDLLHLLGNPLGIVDAEVDQLLSVTPLGSLNVPSTSAADLASLVSDRTQVPYPANSGGTSACSALSPCVWNAYANQPAAQIIRVSDAQSQFGVTGSGIVADIDTGVDPTHPALQSALLPGCDFTRNQPDGSCQPGGSELNDISFSSCPFTSCPPPPCPDCSSAQVNQSTAAVLDQSTAAVLDCNQQTPCQYAAFGHGTMVMGVIHLVAPTAQLMPLKTFKSDGTGFLSDILRAVYYAVQNNAQVINMSFDTQTYSQELRKALNYANRNNVICVASAGNEAQSAPPLTVYPAEWQNSVMGVASTSDQDTRSSFSNYGNPIVWVAAPGEAIVSTYPFGTYAAGWGTSFSAPFVSGGAALLLNRQANINEPRAARAVAHAVPVGPQMGHGRLDLVQALGAVPASDPPPTGSIDSPSGDVTILAGQSIAFSGSGSDPDGEITAYSWSLPGGDPDCSNVSAPGSVTYSTPGTFVVTFTVTDDAGLKDPNPKTRTILVLP